MLKCACSRVPKLRQSSNYLPRVSSSAPNCTYLQRSHRFPYLPFAASIRYATSKAVREGLDFAQVDAFTPTALAGNPAAVLFTQRDGDADWMQAVAVENNLSETAFVEECGDGNWNLRWFTPGGEVDLCGHATLGAAHALWETDRVPPTSSIEFQTRKSGKLLCRRTADGWIRMEFPVQQPTEISGEMGEVIRKDLAKALGLMSDDILYLGKGPATTPDWLVEVSPLKFATLDPDFGALSRVKPMDRGVNVTCSGVIAEINTKSSRVLKRSVLHGNFAHFDFSSRSFFPSLGVNEDPVCGSAHCILVPFWAPRLNKGRRERGEMPLLAFQASARGGILRLQWLPGDRVSLEGEAVLVLKGQLFV